MKLTRNARLVRKAILVGFGLCVSIVLEAAEYAKYTGDLKIHHKEGVIYNETLSGTRVPHIKLVSQMSFKLRDGESVAIEIVDPNPLIFKYEWKQNEKVETDDYKAVKTFGETGTSLLATLTAKTAAVRAPSAIAPQRGPHAAPGQPAAPSPPQTPETQLIECLKRKYKITDTFFADLSSDAYALDSYVSSYPTIVLKSASADSAMLAALKNEAQNTNAQVSSVKAALGQLFKYLAALRQPPVSLATGCDGVDLAAASKVSLLTDPETQLLESTFYAAARQDFDDTIAAANDLASRVMKINEPVTFDTLDYDAIHYTSGTLTISFTDAFNALSKSQRDAVQATGPWPIGKFTLQGEPSSPVSLKVGPALVYSFVSQPQYTATPSGTQFVITRIDQGDKRKANNLAAMLSVAPTRWNNPIFASAFQLGLAPQSDNVGFFGGVGFSFYRSLSFGLGLAYQQISDLVPALHVHDVIATPQDLKTSNQFKAGGYITLSVNFDVKK